QQTAKRSHARGRPSGPASGGMTSEKSMNKDGNQARPSTLFAATLSLVCVIAISPCALRAQDNEKVSAGLWTWKTSGCADCHGPFADGDRDDDDFPIGANLRTTKLDATGLRVAIRCGRAGAGMPAFEEGAYTIHSCYGRPLSSAPDKLEP